MEGEKELSDMQRVDKHQSKTERTYGQLYLLEYPQMDNEQTEWKIDPNIIIEGYIKQKPLY